MMRRLKRLSVTILLLLLFACDIVIEPTTPTPGPPPPPESACAHISTDELQGWIDERIERQEKPVAGGVVYVDTPQVTNCIEDSAYFQVHVGYERPGLSVELAVLEHHFALAYYPEQGEVCLDMAGFLEADELSGQGVEQAGQTITVAEVQQDMDRPSTERMPAQTRQELDEALGKAAISGDPETQTIGAEAAEILMDWAVEDLLDELNRQLARLIGACLPAQ